MLREVLQLSQPCWHIHALMKDPNDNNAFARMCQKGNIVVLDTMKGKSGAVCKRLTVRRMEGVVMRCDVL